MRPGPPPTVLGQHRDTPAVVTPTDDMIADAEYVAIVFGTWDESLGWQCAPSRVAPPSFDLCVFVGSVDVSLGTVRAVFDALHSPAPGSAERECGVVEWFQAEADLLGAAQAYLRSRARQGARSAPELIEAWDRFYAQYDPILRRMAFGRVPSRDFDDLMQEVWVELSRKLVRLVYDPTRGRMRDWLRIVVRRKARDFCRQERAGMREVAHSLETIPCYRHAAPDDVAETEDLRSAVRAAIGQLRRHVCESTLQVLQMTHFDSRSVAEIAAQLGLSRQQVWSRQYRGKQALRAILLRRQEFRRASAET